LNPTIGARTLLKHFEKQDPEVAKDVDEMSKLSKREIESKLSGQKQQVAKSLLLEEKLKNKTKGLSSNGLFQSPRLGKGFKSGITITLINWLSPTLPSTPHRPTRHVFFVSF